MELFGAIEGLLKNVSLGAIIERFEPRRQVSFLLLDWDFGHNDLMD